MDKLQNHFMNIIWKTIFIVLFIASIAACNTKKDDVKTSKKAKIATQQIKTTKKEQKVETVKMEGLDIDYCMGRFEPKGHKDFVAIPIKYADREGMYMRSDAFESFKKMYEDANNEGIKFQIRSAARNFNYQKGIWERKWTGATKLSDGTNVATDIKTPQDKALKILEYSSMPGTSRHHWGTDIDLNSFDNAFFEKGKGKIMYDWLTENASKYGYCQPYTPKGPNRPDGYNEEKWHWSYQPISQGITDFAEQNLKNEFINGFKGSETAIEIDVVGKYVLGIHQGCRH